MKVNATLSLFFEISGSYIYGEEVGYAEVHIDVNTDVLPKTDLAALVKEEIEKTAEICKVPVENIKVIPRKEYTENTEE